MVILTLHMTAGSSEPSLVAGDRQRAGHCAGGAWPLRWRGEAVRAAGRQGQRPSGRRLRAGVETGQAGAKP